MKATLKRTLKRIAIATFLIVGICFSPMFGLILKVFFGIQGVAISKVSGGLVRPFCIGKYVDNDAKQLLILENTCIDWEWRWPIKIKRISIDSLNVDRHRLKNEAGSDIFDKICTGEIKHINGIRNPVSVAEFQINQIHFKPFYGSNEYTGHLKSQGITLNQDGLHIAAVDGNLTNGIQNTRDQVKLTISNRNERCLDGIFLNKGQQRKINFCFDKRSTSACNHPDSE